MQPLHALVIGLWSDGWQVPCQLTFFIRMCTLIGGTIGFSIVFALLFFLIGKLKLSKVVSYVPTSIIEAFLSCVGYKVREARAARVSRGCSGAL